MAKTLDPIKFQVQEIFNRVFDNAKNALEFFADSLPLPTGASTSAKQGKNFFLEVSKGNVAGHTYIHKFGLAPDFDTGDNAVDIWEGANDAGANLMSYTLSSSADIDSLSSSDNGDTQTIVVEGLDTDWNFVSQEITLTGQTRKALVTDLIRVFRMYNTGSTDFAGTIYCFVDVATSSGVPNTLANVRALIDDGKNQTLMTTYTVPNGKKAYMLSFFAATQGSKKATNIEIILWAREFGSVFRVQEVHALDDDATSHFNHIYKIPTKYPAKTDFKWTAKLTESAITGASVGAGYELTLVDD